MSSYVPIAPFPVGSILMLFPVFAAKVGKNWESFARLPSGLHDAFRE
jgi:hypothetical protein